MSTTIVVSPIGQQLENTGEVIKLEVSLRDEDWLGTYDKLEVWRSTTEQSGPYSELTASELRSALLPLGAGDPPSPPVVGPLVALDGLELKLLIDEKTPLTITFSGVDPISYGDAASQIIAQAGGLVTSYVTSLGELVVATADSGTGASLRALSSDGASQLNLPVDELVYGRAARLNLCEGKSFYLFEDLFGSAEYYYKIRFRNSVTHAVSEFSLPHVVGTRLGTSTNNLAIGMADLIQGDGKALINQLVQLRAEFTGVLVDGAVMAGTTLAKTTDIEGHVEFAVVRGQKFDVSVPGTSLFRTITVPTDPNVQTFNLFDPSIADEDIFKVQVPEIVIAERRSL